MSRTPLLSLGRGDARRPTGLPRKLAVLVRAMRRDALACRARRVVILILGLWMINIGDLLLTICARDIGGFHEANPLAAPLIACTPALVAFKLSLLSASSLIMLVYRRHVLTEIGCWVLLTAYTGLCFIWMQYYSLNLLPPV
jgi:hypothetical protein